MSTFTNTYDWRILLLLAAAAALMGNTRAPIPTTAHCVRRPGPVGDSLPAMLTLLNGQVVDSLSRQTEIVFAETICWDKAERMFDVSVSLVVYSVWTAPSPYTLLVDDLRNIVEAEQSHAAKFGGFAKLEAIADFALSPRITVEVLTMPDGLVVKGSHNQMDYICYAYLGRAEPPLSDMAEGEPSCESQHGLGPWGTGR